MGLCALIATAVRRSRRGRLKQGGRRRSRRRTSDRSPAGRPTERRRVQAPDRCGHVMALRSRSSASTDSTGATRIDGGDRRHCGRGARGQLAGVGHEPASAGPGWMSRRQGGRNPGPPGTGPLPPTRSIRRSVTHLSTTCRPVILDSPRRSWRSHSAEIGRGNSALTRSGRAGPPGAAGTSGTRWLGRCADRPASLQPSSRLPPAWISYSVGS